MSSNLKYRAIKLRRSGYFYAEIASELGLAKSTAYMWTHKEVLEPKQVNALVERLRQNKRRRIKYLAILKRQKREERDRQIQQNAIQIVNASELALNHKRLLCAILFWCEGGKDVAGGIRFMNSDPEMIRTFLVLLRQSFELDESKFRALVHLHEYHDQQKQLKFWSNLTKIPLGQFNKPYLKPHTGINTREGYPGCISVRYHDGSFGKLLKMIYIEFSKSIGA